MEDCRDRAYFAYLKFLTVGPSAEPRLDAAMTNKTRALDWKGYEGQDYEQFWWGPGKRYLDEVEHLVVAYCLPGGHAIADIGGGFGRLANCYIGKYRKVHFVEPAGNLRDVAQRIYGEAASYHDASVNQLPFSNDSLDAVVLVRVCHHLGDPTQALLEIQRVLKPGGTLVFNYSNKRNAKRIVQWLLRRAASPFNRDIEPYAEALFGHHPCFVDDVLSNVGFTVVEEYGTGVVDKFVDRLPSIGRILPPSLTRARLAGRLRLAPSQFIVARKTNESTARLRC